MVKNFIFNSSRLINSTVPNTIEEGKILKSFSEKTRILHSICNQNLVLEGAKRIGAVVVNLGAEDLHAGKPYLVFGLLWQIIKIASLKEVSLERHPEVWDQLGDSKESLGNVHPEELLLKWLNYHFRKSTNDDSTSVSNFSSDLKGSEPYIRLMNQLFPEICDLEGLNVEDPLERAKIVIRNAEKLGIKLGLTESDIISGNEKLNLLLSAALFNKHLGNEPLAEEVKESNTRLTKENKDLKENVTFLGNKVMCLTDNLVRKEEEVAVLVQQKHLLVEENFEKIENLTNEKFLLETKIVRCEEELALKTQIIEENYQKINELTQTNCENGNKISKLIAENVLLSSRLDSLQEENSNLQGKASRLLESNERLLGLVESTDLEKKNVEFQKLKLSQEFEQINSRLHLTANELAKERLNLENSELSGVCLANDLEDLRGKQEKLEYLIEHLKYERARSDLHIERLKILYRSFPSTESLCEAIYSNSLSLENLLKNSTKFGYLTKKARNGYSWKYRFFILKDNFLFFFRHDKDPNSVAKGVIRVDDAALKFTENPTKVDLKGQAILCIQVPNNNDVFERLSFYVAGEDADLEHWNSAIKTAAGWWTKRSLRRI